MCCRARARVVDETMTSHMMTSHILDSSAAALHGPRPDDVINDELRQPVSSVLAAYRQHTAAVPAYWPAPAPATSTPTDVIMTSYCGAGYVVHPGASAAGLISSWMAPARPSVDRLTELGVSGYTPQLSAYSGVGGGVELKPWSVDNYLTPPSAAVSPHFNNIPKRLTGVNHTFCMYFD